MNVDSCRFRVFADATAVVCVSKGKVCGDTMVHIDFFLRYVTMRTAK